MNEIVKAPDYCLANSGVTTQRQWRRFKRKHLHDLRKALEQVRLGCAYTPNGEGTIGQLDGLIAKLETLWSPKEWGK